MPNRGRSYSSSQSLDSTGKGLSFVDAAGVERGLFRWYASDPNGAVSGPLGGIVQTPLGLWRNIDGLTGWLFESGAVGLNVRNETGAPLLRGRLVSVVGYSIPEDVPLVQYADKDDPTKQPAIGILAKDAPNGTNMTIIVSGLLPDVDTSAFTLTAQLVLGNAGAYTLSPPDAAVFTGKVQFIGSVLRVGVADGQISVLIQGLNTLEGAEVYNVRRTLGRGWQEGGTLTRGAGLLLNVDGGKGFVSGPGGATDLTRVVWAPQVLLLAADSTLSIAIDSAGVAFSQVGTPDGDQNIVLGEAETDGASIPFLSIHQIHIERVNADDDLFVTEVIGTTAVSGLLASIAGGLALNVGSGAFYLGNDRYTVPTTVGATWTYWYRDGLGGFTAVPGAVAIDSANYDDGSGVLAPIPAGQFKQDLLFITTQDESGTVVEYHVVYAQQTYATQLLAESGNLPAPPTVFVNFALRSSGIVVDQGGAAILSIVDQRPFLNVTASGTTAITVHGLLSALSAPADDHTQYVLLTGNAGRNPFTGTLDITGGDLILPVSAVLPTIEGQVRWDGVANLLYVGDGVGTKTFTPGISSASFTPMVWGNGTVTATTTTRFLTAGFDPGTAPAVEIPVPLARAGVLRNLYVRHNGAQGNGLPIVYTVMVNGVATGITCSLATGAVGQASDVVNTAVVAAGDRVSIQVTKALAVGTSPADITASFEYGAT